MYLYHDEKLVMSGTDIEIMKYIHDNHPFSLNHACKHEGYRITLVPLCEHESYIPANGQGSFCKHCGETLA